MERSSSAGVSSASCKPGRFASDDLVALCVLRLALWLLSLFCPAELLLVALLSCSSLSLGFANSFPSHSPRGRLLSFTLGSQHIVFSATSCARSREKYRRKTLSILAKQPFASSSTTFTWMSVKMTPYNKEAVLNTIRREVVIRDITSFPSLHLQLQPLHISTSQATFTLHLPKPVSCT